MSIRQDLGFSWRTAVANPVFTLVAVASLALGIGANTAIFTFVNAALLKPLPYPEADRIVAVEQRPLRGQGNTPVDPRSFLEWKDHARSFEALAIAQVIPVNTDGIDAPEQVPGLWTTPELFRVFRVPPAIGHVFTEQWSPGKSSEVLLSHEYWQRRFGGERGVLGKSIAVGQDFATIIGVLPAGFRVGTLNVDLYIPMPLDANKPEAVGSRAQTEPRPQGSVTTKAPSVALLSSRGSVEQYPHLVRAFEAEILIEPRPIVTTLQDYGLNAIGTAPIECDTDGKSDVLCTRNIRHLDADEVRTFFTPRGIRILTDLDIPHDLLDL